jgi:GT2 family glycosyltransferase
VTRGCGRDAGIFNLERHRATTASRTESGSPRAFSANRLHVRGKSLYEGDTKLHVRGVTYGTFRPDEETSDFPSVESVAEDFAGMAANGVNAVRTYTVPPRWLLDLASEHRLYVMVGLPWEEHVTFLDDRKRTAAIEERMREMVRSCAGHPAILCYAIGNEIPASIVRWHGKRQIERFLKRLYCAAKSEDPGALVTYVNYPSTEYLSLPFVDLVCFNVFLESGPQFASYLARLQHIAGDRPLVVTEAGLDSLRNSEEAQARALDWQVRTAFSGGCAGMFVFSWTDEWYRGGSEIDDWAFGLVDRNRTPKQALATVGKAYAQVPFVPDPDWPRVSVVVCAYNSESTLRSCFDGLRDLEYPDYEVIVVNDGSTDATDEITGKYDFRLITTENRGLSSARNAGLRAATGEIVAYLDADATPDPHWLCHLATAFMKSSHAGIGGPNIPPLDDGPTAECVANAPGGPIHVLLSDEIAEHIPGCNMAFWKASLEAIGGFDPQFRIAGDDVDICWRLQDQGWTVGFSPGAVVWHHRRGCVNGYLKQQFEYGKAEALLERKWPERYNRMGHLAWAGRVYGAPLAKVLGGRWKIYYGTWGTGLFQSVYQRAPGILGSLPLMPEFYLVIALLAGLSLLGIMWTPLLVAVPLLIAAAGSLVFKAALGGAHASVTSAGGSRRREQRMRLTTTFLYMAQPAARLAGRLRHGLSPWRRRSAPRLSLPVPRTTGIWSERWRAPDERVRSVESALRRSGGVIFSGGEYERWDLHVRGGMLGSMRMRMAVEEHGGGRQLLRIRSWPRFSRIGTGVALGFGALATGAALSGAWVVAGVMAVVVAVIVTCVVKDCATAAGVLTTVLKAEAREAQRELEPVTKAGVNGHGPDGGREHDGALTTNGTRELPGQNVAFGASVQMSEFREGDK